MHVYTDREKYYISNRGPGDTSGTRSLYQLSAGQRYFLRIFIPWMYRTSAVIVLTLAAISVVILTNNAYAASLEFTNKLVMVATALIGIELLLTSGQLYVVASAYAKTAEQNDCAVDRLSYDRDRSLWLTEAFLLPILAFILYTAIVYQANHHAFDDVPSVVMVMLAILCALDVIYFLPETIRILTIRSRKL